MKLAALVTAALASARVSAHDTGYAHVETPGWTFDTSIVAPLLVSALLFAIGVARLLKRSEHGSTQVLRRGYFFAAGWTVLVAALVSPLHQAGERSFAAHMFEHELIMLAAAPMIVLSEPLAIMLWALPGAGRRVLGRLTLALRVPRVWRWLTQPVVATLLQAAALWLWHAPVFFDLALAQGAWHVAQHASFLFTALLFWAAMIERQTPAPIAAFCLVATSIVTGALGALMVFATSPWFAGYAALGLTPFELTPEEDQQIAGLLMWVPGGLVHAGAALIVMRRFLRQAHA